MIKRSWLRVLLALGFVFTVASAVPALAAIQYSGSLQAPKTNGLDGTGYWVNAENPVTFSWLVSEVGVQNGAILWNYAYTISAPAGASSHVIIELSDGFTVNDISNIRFNGTPIEECVYDDDTSRWEISNFSQGGSNPYMKDGLFGIKINTPNDNSNLITTYSFDSTHAPVWGDFYSKDGMANSNVFNTAWNEGFLRTDPTADPTNGSIDNHILRPDTVEQPSVPEASSMLLGALGLMPVLGMSIRKWRK
ncbi:MAG: hypothetical protein ABFD54_18065 [Armatimonadota bacterium]|nr:hypothetical protein [bacterium]